MHRLDRRSVHARARARNRAALRRVRHPADHDRADRGLRRPHAPACGRARWCSVTTVRPGSSRCCTSTRRSTKTSRSASSRSARTRSRSPAAASTRWCSTRSSPTRPSSAASRPSGGPPRRPGRDPASVRIWSCYATIGDHLPETLRLKKTVGRLATYLQGYGDLLVETNGWDPEVLGALPRRRRGVDVPGRARHARPTPRCSNTSRRCCPTSGSSPRRPATRARCAARVLAPVRPRRRRRHHARRDTDGARAGRRRVSRDPTPGSLRRLAPRTPAPRYNRTDTPAQLFTAQRDFGRLRSDRRKSGDGRDSRTHPTRSPEIHMLSFRRIAMPIVALSVAFSDSPRSSASTPTTYETRPRAGHPVALRASGPGVHGLHRSSQLCELRDRRALAATAASPTRTTSSPPCGSATSPVRPATHRSILSRGQSLAGHDAAPVLSVLREQPVLPRAAHRGRGQQSRRADVGLRRAVQQAERGGRSVEHLRQREP